MHPYVVRLRGRGLASLSYLVGVNDEKVDLTDDNLVSQRVLCRNRVLLVIPALEHLLPGDLEHFEQDFYEVGAVEVVEVLLSEVSFVSRLNACNDNGLTYFGSIFDQATKCAV